MSRMSRSLQIKTIYIKYVKFNFEVSCYGRQEDLAEALGLSRGTISKFFNGKPIERSNFQEICDCLGLNCEEIADFQEEDGKFSGEEEYVERPPIEDDCFKELLNPGALVRIKAPILMGKTALIKRTFSKIKIKGYQTVYINMNSAGKADFADLEQFLKWFCLNVGDQLGLENRLADYWNEKSFPSKINCQRYFKKYLLAQVESPLVLSLDEVEKIFPYENVAADFLGLLRAWHEEAKFNDVWRKLHLLLSYSTETYVQLDYDSSPFNVGFPIELPEFTQEQVQHLAKLYEINLSEREIKQLMDLVHGHPYLTKQALSYLKNNKSTCLEEILQTAVTEVGIYSKHLRHILKLILHSELLEACKQVILATSPIHLNSFQAYKLHSMGLVHLGTDGIKPRCNLYRQYLTNQFNLLNPNESHEII